MDLSWLQLFWDQISNASAAANVLTVGAVTLWVVTAISAWRTAQLYTVGTSIGTAYCFIGEYLAIRLGNDHTRRSRSPSRSSRSRDWDSYSPR